jgi:hypothetical protein
MEVKFVRPEPWTAEWFAALIENAREDADELRHIETFLDTAEKLIDDDRRRLRKTIDQHLSTAEPSPRNSRNAKFRWPHMLHDTTAYDDPTTTVIFLGPKAAERMRRNRQGKSEKEDK